MSGRSPGRHWGVDITTIIKIQFKVSNYSQLCEGAQSEWLVSAVCTLCGMRWIGAGLPVQNGVLRLGARGNWLKAEMQQREGTNTLLRVRIGYAEGARKRRNEKGWERRRKRGVPSYAFSIHEPTGGKEERCTQLPKYPGSHPEMGEGLCQGASCS